MIPNTEGFLQPVINESVCRNCGKCKEVCPALDRWETTKSDESIYYAYQHPDETVLGSSTSGGAFSAIIGLYDSPNVCGVIADNSMYVKHIISKSRKDIEAMRGSKYVQSDIGDNFRAVGEKLKNDETVIFTGTSCYVHGLIKYLTAIKIDMSKLITIDLICHGVPSNLMHREYLDNYQKKKNKLIISHKFRSKYQDWGIEDTIRNYIQILGFKDNKVDINSLDSQLYVNVFFSELCLRESCYECPYTCEDKPADITLADFWGIEYSGINIINKEKGCSLVLARGKGKDIVGKLSHIISLDKEQIKIAQRYQSHLYKPIARPLDRDKFWEDYYKKDFEFVARKYFHYSFKYRIYMLIYIFFNMINLKRLKMTIGKRIFY